MYNIPTEQPQPTPEVRFRPKEDLYKEYGYTTPTPERSDLELVRFKRSFERQIEQFVRYDPFATQPRHATLPLPEVNVFKKEDGSYVYEYRLSKSYTMLLSSKTQLMEVLDKRPPVDAFRIEHLLVTQPDGKVADALAQYPRQVPNFLTFAELPKDMVAFASINDDYIMASSELGLESGRSEELVYTLLHENAHIELQDVDAKRPGRASWLSKPWNTDAEGRAYMAGRERDANAFALRVGKRLGIDTRRQTVFYQASADTYDKPTQGDDPALYANSGKRKKTRQAMQKPKL